MATANLAAKSAGHPASESFANALSRASSDADKLPVAAKQFEGLIAGQVLRAAREASDGGWLGSDDDDQAGELTLEMAEQGFAQALAERGGLGIAKMVVANLQPKTKIQSAVPSPETSGYQSP